MIDIQHSNNLIIANQGNYNFRFGQTAATYMSWKFLYILNYNSFHLFPGGSANTSAFFNSRAGYRSLKRSQQQLIFFYQVKANPQPSKLLFQCCSYIGEVCNQIRFALQNGCNLGNKFNILFFL